MAPQSPTTSSRRKRLRLIDNWRSGLRMLCVQVLLVLGGLVEGWMFLVGLLTLLLAITTIPEIVLWLPHSMGYVTQ